MSASDHLNAQQFDGMTFHHGGPGELPDAYPYSPAGPGEYEARAQVGDRTVGQVKWLTTVNPNAGVKVGSIIRAGVHPDYQRQGVATELLRRAREVEPDVHHSNHLTGDGAAWAKARP